MSEIITDMNSELKQMADEMLESEADPEELKKEFPEAYQLLENFVEADNATSSDELRSLYYESVDVLEEIREKYGEGSEEFEEISQMQNTLAATPGYR